MTQRPERQRLLKRLQDHGILLAAVSKYTEANIRWNAIELAPADFVSMKINWDPKVLSIGSIAQELFQRTNQFNTTTIRFSKGEVEAIIGDAGHDVFVAELGDKFGQLGIAASVVVERTPESLRIVDFVMSCRARGFGLEQWLLARIVHDLGAERTVLGRFRPTDRNQPAASLFSGAGFRKDGDEDWVLEATDARPEAPDWFAVRER